ncbi:uncharacterized protein LOC126901696 isoform X4 [Daktulosphaira vitifoliae]|uniref:uncharacterized protein LOC126901696 isoform X4 n=1 Tax=Daktulosphaira vitifoliae TaxID=58002 RepID=UPI0021AA8795|nr:uncharacterized protein LOC126901696 isoform X4 [Daktulosphaira vitifoliae]
MNNRNIMFNNEFSVYLSVLFTLLINSVIFINGSPVEVNCINPENNVKNYTALVRTLGLNDKENCPVCLTSTPSVTLIPCCHSYCNKCSQILSGNDELCPLCRTRIITFDGIKRTPGLNDKENCPYCGNEKPSVTAMPCTHSFCQVCINIFKRINTKAPCPVCQKKIEYYEGFNPEYKSPKPVSIELLTEIAEEDFLEQEQNIEHNYLFNLDENIENLDEEVLSSVNNFCKICQINKKNKSFLPCNHNACDSCSEDIKRLGMVCPFCEENVIQILDLTNWEH